MACECESKTSTSPTSTGCCCSAPAAQAWSDATQPVNPPPAYHCGWLDTAGGPVSRVATQWTGKDWLGAARVRLALGRMSYLVRPGLYGVGAPDLQSPVFVTANYKLSFDHLRRALAGLDAWMLVLDTQGVNVWCAAGKGTFGTVELIRRIGDTRLAQVVGHRELIVPQLGAPGVCAREVRLHSGFAVNFGPVRAGDIPAYLAAGRRASPEMRRVNFGLVDRLAVVPVELVLWTKWALAVFALLCLLGAVAGSGISWTVAREALAIVVAGFLGGGVLTPLLLPWLPGRAFAFQGALIGLALAGLLGLAEWSSRIGPGGSCLWAAELLLIPAGAAFMAMNFTGASTYTSLSGVRKEMRYAVPAQIAASVIGLGFWLGAAL